MASDDVIHIYSHSIQNGGLHKASGEKEKGKEKGVGQ